MKIVILDASTLGNDISWDKFKAFGELSIYPLSRPDEIGLRIADADVVVTNKCHLSEEALGHSQKLRLILEAATGFDNIDTAFCRSKGIAVANVKAYSTASVAQLTLAMALSLSTRLEAYRSYCADGSYSRSGLFTRVEPVWNELDKKTWGIVGAGTIGSKVAAVAEALGCEVITWQRRPSERYQTVPLDELLSRSDIISLHVPLNEATRGLISRERLKLVKPSAILINVARGQVLDETAVVDALLNKELGGFGCDVFAPEPFPEEHPFSRIRDLPNVILTPHMGWASAESRQRLMDALVRNLSAYLAGQDESRIV